MAPAYATMTACLVVMAKQPKRGRVKTRIAAAVGEDRAVELYRCALRDTLELALSIAGVAHVVSYAPSTRHARQYFEQVAPDFVLIPQQGASLGERMCGLLKPLLRNHSPVVVIGSDSPDLPAQFITRAFDMLCSAPDVVIGPAQDGGYYLLGMRSMQPVLFERIAWSTAAVAEQTRTRARHAGLQITDLPPWHDLDTVTDLQALTAPGAPLTRAFAAALNKGLSHENKGSGRVEGR